jgi:O-antigen ligase
MSFDTTSARPPHFPRLSPRFRAVALGVAVASGVLFLAQDFASAPSLPFATMGGAAFLFACFANPLWAFAAFVFVHIAVPVYVRLPTFGPLPAAPVAGAMWAMLAATTFVSGRRVGYRGIERRFMAFLLLYAAIAALSLIDDRTTSEGVNMWFKAIGFPLIVLLVANRVLRSAADVDRVFEIMLVAGSIVSAYAIWEFAIRRNYLMEIYFIPTQSDLFANEYEGMTSLGGAGGVAYRSFSVFTNSLEFGTCVGMIYPYAVVRLVGARSGAQKVVFALAAALCFFGIATTFSRGPLLALALVTLGLAITLRPSLFSSPRRVLVAMSGFLAAALVGWFLFGTSVAQRVGDIDNVTLRFKEWEQAIAIFGEHPLIGVGIGNFPQYQLDAIRDHRIGPIYEFGADSPERMRVAENTYLQLAAETGVLGIFAFAATMVTFFAMVGRMIRKRPDGMDRNLAIGIGAGAATNLVNGLTITGYTHYVSTMLFIGVFLASALVLDRVSNQAGGNSTRMP